MRKLILSGFSVLFVFGMFMVLFPKNSEAIPPFARKYATACTTCHWGTFPKLNAFGRSFLANGLRMPGGGDEVFVKDAPIKMGASAWSRLFPKAVWPGTIPYMIPIGFKAQTGLQYRNERPKDYRGGDGGSPKRGQDVEFYGIDNIEVLFGGTFGETLSFFGAGLFHDLERAYINYSPFIGGEQGLVNVRLGRLDTRANPVSNHLRQIRFQGYLCNEWSSIPTGNFSGFHPSQFGVEFYGGMNGPGGKGGFEWAFGVVNGGWGEGAPHFGGQGDTGTIIGNMEGVGEGIGSEVNNGKDFYVTASYKIGGMGVLGEESVDDSTVAKENWQDDSIRIKGYYYQGTTGAFIDADGPFAGGVGNPLVGGTASSLYVNDANHFKHFGVAVEANWWNFAFIGVASYLEDDITGVISYAATDNLPAEWGSSFDSSIYTGEVQWVALPWLIPAFRVEYVDPDWDVRDLDSFTKYSIDVRLVARANFNVSIGGTFSSYPDAETGTDGADIAVYDIERLDDYFRIEAEFAF